MMDSADGPCRGEFVKAGYLVKSPPLSRALVSQWQRRWFLLMDSRLVYPLAERYVRLAYYQSEADAKRLADPKGSINLNSCLSVVSLNEPIKHYKFVFDVCTTERVYHLAADSEDERTEWVSTLKDLLQPFPTLNDKNSHVSKVTTAQESPEVVRRPRNSRQRPLSYTGSESKPRVQSRPLPPVPDVADGTVPSSPVDRKHRPLPPPPAANSGVVPQGAHIHPVGSQSTTVVPPKRLPPPAKPPPYRKPRSEPNTPTSLSLQLQSKHSCSVSPPAHSLSAEDYQEFVSQPICFDVPSTEDNYSLATSVPRQQVSAARKPAGCDDEYSVLETAVVQGYDPTDKDYSHLEPHIANDSPPPPIRHSSLAPYHVSDSSLQQLQQLQQLRPQVRPRSSRQRPHSAVPDYVNYPAPSDPTNEDYSHLHH